jgi:ADP-heptose:LPS heptosyltransferase
MVVIQLARLGDFLQTTPLLAALRAAHPQSQIAAVVACAQAPLARACRFVDQVLALDPATLQDAADPNQPLGLGLARLSGLTRHLWEFPAEAVYNLNLSDLAAGLAGGWPGAEVHGWRIPSGGGRIVGQPWAAYVMALVGDRRLTRLHLCDILASYANPSAPPLTRLDHAVSPTAQAAAAQLIPTGQPLVGLQLGANSDLRRWPLDSFAGLARGLAKEGATLLLLGAAAEQPLGSRLQAMLGPMPRLANLMGRTDLPTLAAVLQACDLVVGGDTGTLHLATAVGAPCLSLFMGPAQVHETGPYGPGHLVLQARDACGPCQEHRPSCGGSAPCRRLISPRMAHMAARALLAGAPAASAVAGLELPSGVEALEGHLDGFGMRYRPLCPRPLEGMSGLALGLREAGRVLLRPAYFLDPLRLERELAAEHLPAGLEDKAALMALAVQAAHLLPAVNSGDRLAAARLAQAAPGLRPLIGLVGPAAPPRLLQACQTAQLTLELAAQR